MDPIEVKNESGKVSGYLAVDPSRHLVKLARKELPNDADGWRWATDADIALAEKREAKRKAKEEEAAKAAAEELAAKRAAEEAAKAAEAEE